VPDAQETAPPTGRIASGVAEFRRIALALGFGVIALGLFVFLLVIYAPVLRLVLWAAAMAALFFPLHQRILRLVGNRERSAAVLSTTLNPTSANFQTAMIVVNRPMGGVGNFGKVVLLSQFEEEFDVFIQLLLILFNG
jgi:predicted PurR-regulated permease PerM